MIAEASKLNFTGVPGRDVYNITAPFIWQGKTVIAGRVEKRDEELSEIRLFEAIQQCTVDDSTVYSHRYNTVQSDWKLIADGPAFPGLQDPCITTIDGKLLLGGVRFPVTVGADNLAWQMEFYLEDEAGNFDLTWKGPYKMKDIRFAQLADKRLLVLTRPQGEKGGRGKIGYAVVDSLDDVTDSIVEDAPLFDLCPKEEWVGGNEAHLLDDGHIGVLGHIANFDDAGNRHYYAMSFTFDPETGKHSPHKIIARRDDFPAGDAKRPDLVDVIFAGGLVRLPEGRAQLFAGLSDAEGGWVEIEDPFINKVRL